MSRRSVQERFLEKTQIDPATGCWLWTGYIKPNGYGSLAVEGVTRYAHRVAYELFVGEIPPGLQIDHVWARGCRHRHCVNPKHLEAVTQRVNLLRGNTIVAANAAKTACPAGHRYTPETTYVSRAGSRHCRPCMTNRARARRQAVAA